METQYRDNIVAKNRLMLNLTLLWAVSVSLIAIILASLVIYLIRHKETHWLPLCTGEAYVLSEVSFSSQYLKDMGEKAVYLRLTYNPGNIETRFKNLMFLTSVNRQEALKVILDEERETILKKEISSVFYVENSLVDLAHAKVQISGQLYRSSHGIQLKSQHKTYQMQFTYLGGILSLLSMKEVENEHH